VLAIEHERILGEGLLENLDPFIHLVAVLFEINLESVQRERGIAAPHAKFDAAIREHVLHRCP
jgi:hypothetical protein